jgi:hypothetical protein
VDGLSAFLTDFIPGFKSISDKVTSRSSALNIAGLIAGAIVMGAALAIAGVIKMFIGGAMGNIIAIGIGAFGVAAGIKGIVVSFTPLETAVNTVAGGA